jgi:hypothetical protein
LDLIRITFYLYLFFFLFFSFLSLYIHIFQPFFSLFLVLPYLGLSGPSPPIIKSNPSPLTASSPLPY